MQNLVIQNHCIVETRLLLYPFSPLVLPLAETISSADYVYGMEMIGSVSRPPSTCSLYPYEYNVNQNSPNIRLSPAPEERRKLYLYHYNGCLFCWRVKRVIDKLGLVVELRDIWDSSDYRGQLLTARGRQTVPVLLVVDEYGEEQWIPESRDIIHYLNGLPQPTGQ